MPKAGEEFDAIWLDNRSAGDVVRRTTYRYRANGRTVDPVKIVERRIKMAELRFSNDPWQPPHWVYHYGDEITWTPG